MTKVMVEVMGYSVVDYSPRRGAVCPNCGRIRVQTTGARPWFGGPPLWHKQRFHRCECGTTFQSIQACEEQ